MVAAGYFVEQSLHIVISLTLSVLYILQLIVDRRITFAEKAGTSTAHVGKVQYWFHRGGVTCSLLMLLKSIDPSAVNGIFDVIFVNWIHQLVSCILIDSALLMVYWTIDGSYVVLGLHERTPFQLKMAFVALMVLTPISANVTILVRAVTSNSFWGYGFNDIWFAFTEITSMILLTLGVRQLKKVIDSYSMTTASPSVMAAITKLQRMFIGAWLLIFLCVAFQLEEAITLAGDPYHDIYKLDPNSYEIGNFTYFSITIYLALFLFMWYAWMPLTYLTEEGMNGISLDTSPSHASREKSKAGKRPLQSYEAQQSMMADTMSTDSLTDTV